uniref:DUF3615 domain-containing protein n=1 Tax=Oryza brachyantha TaxID=4533 RepID=J3KZC7_ORYBR
MGSVLRSLVLAYDDAKEFMVEKERRAEREVNQLRPAALLRWDGALPLPLDEQRRIVQRWIEYEKRKGPCRYNFLKGEMFACIARPHVRIALRYYNSHHPGAEFDAVRSLNAHFASFRGDDWSHVNFLARRRGCIDAPVLRFFAEISYHGHLAIKPVFVSCTILREEPLFVRRIETVQEPVHLTTKRGANQEQIVHKYRSKCAFCPDPGGTDQPYQLLGLASCYVLHYLHSYERLYKGIVPLEKESF